MTQISYHIMECIVKNLLKSVHMTKHEATDMINLQIDLGDARIDLTVDVKNSAITRVLADVSKDNRFCYSGIRFDNEDIMCPVLKH